MIKGLRAANALQAEGRQANADDGIAARVKSGGLDIHGNQLHLAKRGISRYGAGLVKAHQTFIPCGIGQVAENLLPVRTGGGHFAHSVRMDCSEG